MTAEPMKPAPPVTRIVIIGKPPLIRVYFV
jgi:hypothetical protein